MKSLGLGLCLAAFTCALSGCTSIWPGDSATQPDGVKVMSVTDAQKAVEDAKTRLVPSEDLTNAKTEAEGARAEAAKLKDTYEGMRTATIRSHKNPDDPSTNTYKAGQASKKAEQQAIDKEKAYATLRERDAKARNDLDQANQALAAARKRESKPDGSPTPHFGGTGSGDSLASILLPVILSLAALLVVCLLFWWTWRTLGEGIARNEALLRGVSNRQDEKFRELNAGLSPLKEMDGRVRNLQDEVALLKRIVQTERQERLADRRTNPYAATPVQPDYFEPSVSSEPEDVVQFPISANALLTRLGGHEPFIRPDPLKGILVKDPEGRGQLILIENNSVPGGLTYIVPSVTRFQTREDFYNHYEQFYECSHPAGGEVWLHDPAVVDKVDGGWQLRDKGVLEVR